MNTQKLISDFEESISDTIAEFSGKLSTDELIGTLELQIYALKEAEELAALG